MSRSARIWIGIAAVYGVISIVSFGHAAAHHHCDIAKEVCLDDGEASGMAAALLWPLYWSWELQS